MTPIDVLRSRLGLREDPGRPNQGAVVEWACRRWLSSSTWASEYPKGKLRWCAGAVCSAMADGGVEAVRQVASLSCDTLWQRCSSRGWTWLRGERMPEPGDLIFWGVADDLSHVGLVERVEQTRVTIISGNRGDRVARHYARHDDPTVHGYARIPSVTVAQVPT